MDRGSMSELKGVAEGVVTGKTPGDRVSALQEAFELFSKETVRLETAYQGLQKKLATVNVELERTNRALNGKVAELDVVTQYLQRLLNNMSQGIVFVDLSGEVTTFNASAEKMLGIKADAVLFHKIWELFPDALFGFSLQEALATHQAPSTTYVVLEPDPSQRRDLEISTTFLLEGDTSMRGLIVLLRDITELRRLQRIASRNDRMKELGAMAASVAHEIRNPLGGIKGFAALLVRDLKERPELLQMAQYIVDGATTLDRLVTDVLNYSRPLQMHLEPTDMVSLVTGSCDFAKGDGAFQRICFHVDAATKSIVPLDVQLFRSVLLNLFVNASQAMPQGGNIGVSIGEEKGCCVVAVADQGVGISSENLEKIFSPFFTTKTQGNGFGLCEVHKIVQGHGGTIEVTSEVGKGTTFTMKLPMKA